MTICVAPDCGMALDAKREGPATATQAAGRTETAAGPMHFGCYKRFSEAAVVTAVDLLVAERTKLAIVHNYGFVKTDALATRPVSA